MPERGTTKCRAELPVTRYPTDYGATLAILARFGFLPVPFWEPVCGHEQCDVRAGGDSFEGVRCAYRGCLRGGRLTEASDRARRRFGERETRQAGIRPLRGRRRAVCGQDPPYAVSPDRPTQALRRWQATVRASCRFWASRPGEQQPGNRDRRRLGHRRLSCGRSHAKPRRGRSREAPKGPVERSPSGGCFLRATSCLPVVGVVPLRPTLASLGGLGGARDASSSSV
jgi:hypothetical protein